jgi:hypothetical protein
VRPVDLVLERAANGRKAGNGWLVSCPIPGHGKGDGDANPSVSLHERSDGTALVNCMAGCETVDVLLGWGLEMRDLFPDNGRGGGGPYTSPETASTRQTLAEREVFSI